MTSRAATYLRISDPKGDTADRFGLAVQERACREYAERTGLNVQRDKMDKAMPQRSLQLPGARRKHLEVLRVSKVTMTCARCGINYQLSPSQAKPTRLYCSNECRRTRITRQCAYCGKDFEVKPSAAARSPAKYCSRECVENSPKGVTRPCQNCGEPVYASSARTAAGHGLYCSKKCAPQHQAVPVEERFWSKVKTGGPNDCWEWQAFRNTDGYGLVRHEGRMHSAHRISFLLSGRELVDGLEVMHSCDNPACVNPAHLSLGTHQDNMADRIAKGRHLLTVYRGEMHESAKLTEQQVVRARAEYRAGRATPKQLSIQLGLGASATHSMLSGRTWKHLP